MSQPERVAEALRVIQRTADKQGNVTMLRLAENLANDAALVRLAQSEALRTAARTFVTEMGDTWGGDSQWLTTGTRVAEVVACVLREMAADIDLSPAQRCPTCVSAEGYDRLSGPCPDCQGTGVDPRYRPAEHRCDNYAAPVTCLTAPATVTGRCDHCKGADNA